MDNYIVLYKNIDNLPLDIPLGYSFMAEDSDHAVEQFVDAEPNAIVIWTYKGNDYMEALDDWMICSIEDSDW